jgi:hypothetical protein
MKMMRRISSYGAALAIGALVGTFGATSALANDVDNEVVLTGGTSFFGALHTDNFDFTDTFTFTIDGAVSANVSLITIGDGTNNIDFLSADLNGVALTVTPNGFLESGFLGDMDFTGPLVLTVRGSSDAAGGTFASYSGTMNVIPEPSVALLMGIGLGGLGLSARRVRSRS